MWALLSPYFRRCLYRLAHWMIAARPNSVGPKGLTRLPGRSGGPVLRYDVNRDAAELAATFEKDASVPS